MKVEQGAGGFPLKKFVLDLGKMFLLCKLLFIILLVLSGGRLWTVECRGGLRRVLRGVRILRWSENLRQTAGHTDDGQKNRKYSIKNPFS